MNDPDLHLIHRLRTYGGGANNHTVAKTLFYYEGSMTYATRVEFDILIRKALKTDDWSKLRTRIRGWW